MIRSNAKANLQIESELEKVRSVCSIENNESCFNYTFSHCWYYCCLPYSYLYND